MSDLAEATVNFALTQDGVEEDPRGSNSGPIVSGYLRYVNQPDGNAWCAAFVSFCVNQGAFGLGVHPEFKKSAGAMRLLELNPDLKIDQPEANCIFVIDHGKGKGHTGFVRFLNEDGSFMTIEGNSNDDGSREGYKVCQHQREITNKTYFLRIA
jgi:hypothetical protein